MLSQNPMVPPDRPPLPQLPTNLPAGVEEDAVLTVVDVRAVAVAGFAAGALVPCIPLVLFGAVGIVATLLLNRGTIDFAAGSTSASGVTPLFVFTLLLVILSSGVLGAIMGVVRRWSVSRGIAWGLLVGSYFSSHPGPQSVIALAAVPVLAAAFLHAVSTAAGYTVSFAPLFFIIFPPAWILAGLTFESAWEALIFPLLRSRATEPMKWLSREAVLFSLLKDDSYLFDCRINAVRIDAETGVAHIRGEFRSPEHVRRVREIGLRVVGVSEVEAIEEPHAQSKRLASEV